MRASPRENAAPDGPRSGAEEAEASKHQPVSEYHRASGQASSLDRPLRITKFASPHSRGKGGFRRSLRELAAQLPGRVAASKAELPLLKLATFGDLRTAKGSLRHNANVLAIEGVEGDYDGERMQMADAAKRLRKAGIAAMLYSSPSHRPGKPRWRVLCPTSRPLPPAERERLMARVMGVLDGKLAGESFTLSQTYFYGSVEGQAPARVELVDGAPIDLADELDVGALDKHGEPYGVPAEPVEADDDDDDLRAEPDVERITRALAFIPADDRDTWLRVAQALHHEFGGGEDGFELWDEWSRSSDKYDGEDQRRVWESLGSFVGKAVTVATLFRLEKQHAPKRESFGELTFHTPAECAAAPRRGYVVKGFLAPGDIASIFGAPGAGKSLIAPHIGYMVAQGETAFGMRTKPGVVWYIAVEDATGLRQRVAALRLRHGDAPDFRVVGGVSDLFREDAADLEALADAVAEQGPVLIFIDTLAMAFPGLEENDAKSMGSVVAAARRLAEHGAAVVLIHHDTKAEGSTPRGHSILNGALDMALHVKAEDGIVRGKLTKNRNGTADRDIAFRIDVEELDVDEDGDAITAALAEELTGSAAARPKLMSPSQRAALAILEEREADGPVSNEAWATACVDGYRVSQAEERKSRQTAFRRARSDLVQAGAVEIDAKGNVRSAHPEGYDD